MNWQYTSYATPLFATSLLAAGLASYVWKNRQHGGASVLFALNCAIVLWTFSYAFRLSSFSLHDKLIWLYIEHIGIVATPTLWLIFALRYANRQNWFFRHLYLLSIAPVLTLLVIWTNGNHHYFWDAIYLVTFEDRQFLQTKANMGFWLHAAYSYAVLLLGTHILLREMVRTPGHFRRPMIAVIISVIAPWTFNILYLFQLTPFTYLDLTPFGFFISCIALGWGLLHLQLLDLVPVARDLIVETMRDAIIVIDTQRRVIDLNPAAEGIFSTQRSDVIGKVIANLSPEVDLLLYKMGYQDGVSEFHQFGRSYELRATSVLNEQQKSSGVCIALYDISERLQNELELRRLKEEADEATRKKSSFLAQMNHELRNPLTGIIGYVEVLHMGILGEMSEKQAQFVNNILDSSRHMLSIINDALDMSRIEAGRMTFHLEDVDPCEVVGETERMVLPLIQRQKNKLVVDVVEAPKTIYTDRVKVRQCLLNLLSNATKFTEMGRIMITVRADEVYVYFAVADTGIGMTDEQVARIFNVYTQAESSTGSRYGGTGLGLAISHQFAQLLGGDISVKSTLGTGTTFTLKLPLRAVAPAGETAEA